MGFSVESRLFTEREVTLARICHAKFARRVRFALRSVSSEFRACCARLPRGDISQRGLGLMGRNKMADGLKRFKDQRTNPCLKESKASMKCLDENNYDKNKCAMYFEAYKECKKSWNERKAARRRQGLPPNDPEMQSS